MLSWILQVSVLIMSLKYYWFRNYKLSINIYRYWIHDWFCFLFFLKHCYVKDLHCFVKNLKVLVFVTTYRCDLEISFCIYSFFQLIWYIYFEVRPHSYDQILIYVIFLIQFSLNAWFKSAYFWNTLSCVFWKRWA